MAEFLSNKFLTTSPLFLWTIFQRNTSGFIFVIRFFILVIQNITTLTFFLSEVSATTLLSILLSTVYLYCLFTHRSRKVLGLLYFLIDIFRLLISVSQSSSLYSVNPSSMCFYLAQDYPVVFVYVSGFLYYLHHYYMRYCLEQRYDSFTNTYSLSQSEIHFLSRNYVSCLFMVVSSIFISYLANNIIYDGHEKVKKELEQTNCKLISTAERLRSAESKLDQTIQSQGLLIGSISHEFRNHLNIMLGNIDALYLVTLDQTQAQILQTCKVSGDTLLSQVNNLLDVAKINAGEVEINDFPTKMSRFLDDFWIMMRRNVEKKGLVGEFVVSKAFPLWLNLDNHRLQQVLHNLISNATKFTTEGSVKISFSWTKTKEVFDEQSETVYLQHESPKANSLRIDLRESSERLEQVRSFFNQNDTSQIMFTTNQSVKVALDQTLASSKDEEVSGSLEINIIDTGCGISEEIQRDIFSPFVQGDATVTRKYGGTGLGLYIVKKLIEKMEGTISMDSTLNEGTHFKIKIPATMLSSQGAIRIQTDHQSDGDIHSGRSLRKKSSTISLFKKLPPSSPTKFFTELNCSKVAKKALIVDDIEFNRTIMKTYFQSLDFEVDFACNGLKALQMYQDNPEKYSLITMDIQMPIMDGVTACKYIRSYEKRIGKKKVPIIVVTGNCSGDEKKECLNNSEVDADYFFRKPFGLNDCRLCVQRILSSPN